MKKQAGFTMIELIIVIVILGILAAYAIPKYIGMDKEARISAVKGLKGSVLAASDMVHALATVQNQTGATGSVSVDTGTTVDTVYGYPADSAKGINTALSDTTGFNFTAGKSGVAATYKKDGAQNLDACIVTYTAPTKAGAAPSITIDISGC